VNQFSSEVGGAGPRPSGVV